MAESPGVFNSDLIKRLMVGRAMPSDRAHHQLLPKTLAMAVLSADALSSVAYTVEATVLVLLAGGGSIHQFLMPITICVAGLMAIVVTSYRQTVRAYSSSGGAYVVARENLGTAPALVAAGSLLVGYVLTVAVSVVAGVIAITSVVHSLAPYRVPLAIIFVAFTTFANLRGLRESGILFALPTYGFIISALAVIAIGVVRCLGDCSIAGRAATVHQEASLDLLVLLSAFAVGSSALTGVEAISNAVTIFRRPQGRNAAYTLGVLGAIAVVLVLGIAFLTYRSGATPTEGTSLLSQIGSAALGGSNIFFYLFQAFTFAILVLAANTSFQGFPRLAAMMAKDGFLPRQFENVGDRLVLSNGMIVLAVLSALLIWAFEGNVERLIPLYAVGVFTAFTLSQAGMVVYWRRVGARLGKAGGHWRRSQVVNAVGAAATGLVVAIVVATRFWQGVWVVAVDASRDDHGVPGHPAALRPGRRAAPARDPRGPPAGRRCRDPGRADRRRLRAHADDQGRAPGGRARRSRRDGARLRAVVRGPRRADPVRGRPGQSAGGRGPLAGILTERCSPGPSGRGRPHRRRDDRVPPRPFRATAPSS